MSMLMEKLARQTSPVLTEDEIALLRPYGEERATRAGDEIFVAGRDRPSLVLVLAGRAAIVDRSDGDEHEVTSVGPGEFAGELGLLTGQTVYASCVIRESGAVLVVPAEQVRTVIATRPVLSDLLVPAFAARRQLMMRAPNASLTFIAPDESPAMLPLLEFVNRNQVPYRWLMPEDPAAIALLARTGARGAAGVWAVIRGQKALADPIPIVIAKKLGLDLAIHQEEPVDLAVVGTGPAGLAAAVYAASEGLSTIAVDDVAIGGQAGASSRIENYLGFPTGIAGGDLAFRAEVQALKFGARIMVPHRAVGLRRRHGVFDVELEYGKVVRARSVVIATGARYRRLGLPCEEQFAGAGAYYAATEIEARRCQNTPVVVVGGGNSAGQAAMFLAETAACVDLVCRGSALGHSMSQYLTTRLERDPRVTIHTSSVVRDLHGDRHLEAVTIANGLGEPARIAAGAIFVMIGADPCSDWLRGTVAVDDDGFVLTGLDAPRSGPLLSAFQTSEAGVFAVGDVRSGSVKRVASAVGEGSAVVQAIHRYLASQRPAEAVAGGAA